jgi:xanthine dehydrogenase molybdopterin-binding subunit B
MDAQKHFFMETQASIAIPDEDNRIKVRVREESSA